MPPVKYVIEAGQKFGRLTVVDPSVRVPRSDWPGSTLRAALCRCDCGNLVTVRVRTLCTGGRTGREGQSCGCIHAERMRSAENLATLAANGRSAENIARLQSPDFPKHRTHGLTSHQLYDTWRSMVERCTNPQDEHFVYYGARGISVCDEWHDVAAFVTWIEANLGPRPDGLSLDRIDNDGNYEPGNVRWADAATQLANRRPWGSVSRAMAQP